MAGDKGKGKLAEQRGGEERGDKGKGKRTSLPAEQQRGGEERGPKIRKVTQEEMGKRKGKLQIKERDKPMELEKARRLEEKGRKIPRKAEKVAAEKKWEDFAKRMTEKEVAFCKSIVEQDYEYLYLTEDLMAVYPDGPDAARELNDFVREQVTEFKEISAARVKEYEEKGYIEGYPECRIHPDTLKLLK